MKQETGQSLAESIRELRLDMRRPRRNRAVVPFRALPVKCGAHCQASVASGQIVLAEPAEPPAQVELRDVGADEASARKLFKFVAGVLSGAYSEATVFQCAREILAWLPDEASRHHPDDSDKPFSVIIDDSKYRVSFTIACRALSAAIGKGVVPTRGILVLQTLRGNFPAHGVATDSPLCDLLCGRESSDALPLSQASPIEDLPKALSEQGDDQPSTAEQSEDDEPVSSVDEIDETTEEQAEFAVETEEAVEDNISKAPVVQETLRDVAADEASARKLFKFVAGVLNGAYSEANVLQCAREILAWLPEEASRHHPDDSDKPIIDESKYRVSFTIACRALAVAIRKGVVPTRGILVLQTLRGNFPAHGVATDSPLCDLLCGQESSDALPLSQASPIEELPKTPVSNASDPSTAEQSEEDEPISSVDEIDETTEEQAEIDVETEKAVEDDTSKVPIVQDVLDKPAAAHQLFKFVAGYLNGAYGLSAVVNCSAAVQFWFQACVESVLRDPRDDYQNVSVTQAGCFTFGMALDALAMAIEDGQVPKTGMVTLLELWDDRLHQSTRFVAALKSYLCPMCCSRPPAHPRCRKCSGSGQKPCDKCHGSGRFKLACRSCSGTGRGYGRRMCPGCLGSGQRDQGSCNRCHGKKASVCDECDSQPSEGCPRPFCDQCLKKVAVSRAEAQAAAAQRRETNQSFQQHGPPEKGVKVERCNPSDLSWLQSLWKEREANGNVVEAWKVENPLLAHHFRERRDDLKRELGHLPHDLQGFHGTHPDNILSICENGFDRSKRGSAVGQVFGAGEYFAKNPNVSVGYCREGEYMLVCRLTLGFESSDQSNSDGDHIWVPSNQYYVISSPAQVLPQYIVKFAGASRYGYSSPVRNVVLEKTLKANMWTTIKANKAIVPVPPPRPCLMSRPTATVLWMGLFHSHISDEQLQQDVRRFLGKYAAPYVAGMKVQIASTHFKKAHAVLEIPIPRNLVHKLNTLPFTEGGQEHRICIEDAHGSPEQKCPKSIAGYCRGQNLRHTHPCWCHHEPRKTEHAKFHLKMVCLDSAKGNEIVTKFMTSAPFHNGRPQVVEIKEITNETLSRCHEQYRSYLSNKHKEEPSVRELYHGTNNNILDVLYTHGLQPPSDFSPSEACPVSGGRGLCTSLCTNSCKHCTEKHEWNKCHMFGLGIYLGDIAQKSHRYCSQPQIVGSRKRFRMVVCSVLGKAFKIAGHLKTDRAMHDVPNVRALNDEDLADMIEPCRSHNAACCQDKFESAEKSDMLFIQGLGSAVRPGYSVVNSEYIAFHPHQCLPRYEITYELREDWY
jgi:hypothetical protein